MVISSSLSPKKSYFMLEHEAFTHAHFVVEMEGKEEERGK